MLHRLILWVSLAGMILAIHTWVQKARGFDQGCFGLESHAVSPAEGGCSDAELQASNHLFGVSNAAWGYAFYFGLAVLSFAKLAVSAVWSRRFHALGEIAVALAAIYSAYLLYLQAFVIGRFCVLCLTSSVLVAALVASHVAVRRRGYQPVSDTARATELGLAGGALFLAMGVLIGVLVFVNRLGTRPLDQGNGAAEMRRMVGRWLPAYIEPQKLNEMRACHFDGLRPILELDKLIEPTTPFLGKADGIPIVIILDPHCPHCREVHEMAMKLAEKYRDRARFYFVVRPLWDFSIPAAASLKLAQKSGKYFELWKLQFERPGRARLNIERLADFHRQLGLDATHLAAEIETVRPQVLADRKRAIAAGIDELPAMFINGQEVFWTSYSEECLSRLIEGAVAAAQRPSVRDAQK